MTRIVGACPSRNAYSFGLFAGTMAQNRAEDYRLKTGGYTDDYKEFLCHTLLHGDACVPVVELVKMREECRAYQLQSVTLFRKDCMKAKIEIVDGSRVGSVTIGYGDCDPFCCTTHEEWRPSADTYTCPEWMNKGFASNVFEYCKQLSKMIHHPDRHFYHAMAEGAFTPLRAYVGNCKSTSKVPQEAQDSIWKPKQLSGRACTF